MIPDEGPDDGGQEILLLGQNFDPFYSYAMDHSNETFCSFEDSGVTPARVINNNKVVCTVPPNYEKREVQVELTLNDQ